MKKMIFTAMAVLAFSAVSVANTIEVKEEVVVNNESQTTKKIIKEDRVATPCEDQAIDNYEYIMCEYNNGGDDIALLNYLLSFCYQ